MTQNPEFNKQDKLYKNCHKLDKFREFPGGPVVKTWCFHCQGLGSIPGQGTKTLQAMQYGHKKREKLDSSEYIKSKIVYWKSTVK